MTTLRQMIENLDDKQTRCLHEDNLKNTPCIYCRELALLEAFKLGVNETIHRYNKAIRTHKSAVEYCRNVGGDPLTLSMVDSIDMEFCSLREEVDKELTTS